MARDTSRWTREDFLKLLARAQELGEYGIDDGWAVLADALAEHPAFGNIPIAEAILSDIKAKRGYVGAAARNLLLGGMRKTEERRDPGTKERLVVKYGLDRIFAKRYNQPWELYVGRRFPSRYSNETPADGLRHFKSTALFSQLKGDALPPKSISEADFKRWLRRRLVHLNRMFEKDMRANLFL